MFGVGLIREDVTRRHMSSRNQVHTGGLRVMAGARRQNPAPSTPVLPQLVGHRGDPIVACDRECVDNPVP